MAKTEKPVFDSLEDLQEALKKSPTETKKGLSNEDLATYALEFGQTKKSVNTLKKDGKDKIVGVIMSGEAVTDEKQTRTGSTSNKGFAESIIEIAEELKKAIKGSNLNPFIKKRGVASIQNGLDKATLYDENLPNKLGIVGSGLTAIALFIDVFIGLDTIPEKIREFRKRKEPVTIDAKEVKPNEPNKK